MAEGRESEAEDKKEIKRENSGIFLSDFDFQIDLKDRSSKKLVLRASYFFGPRLYLDNKRVKPVKKQRLKRTKIYHVYNDNENYEEIKLKQRLLDAIPELFINGERN